MIYILAISSGLLAFAVISIVIRMIMRDRIAVLDRINYQIGQFTNDQPVKIRKKKKARDPVSLAIANELSNAGINMRPNEFLILWVIAIILIPGLLWLLDAHTMTTLAAAIIGFVLPPLLIRNRKKKRLIIFEKQLGEALVLIGNCLRAGMTFQQAMSNVSR